MIHTPLVKTVRFVLYDAERPVRDGLLAKKPKKHDMPHVKTQERVFTIVRTIENP